jgi:hypothetical protein
MLGAQQHSDRAHSSVEPHLLQQSTPINWQLSTAGHYYDTSTIVYLQEEAPVDIVTPWRANQDATFEWLPCKWASKELTALAGMLPSTNHIIKKTLIMTQHGLDNLLCHDTMVKQPTHA